MFIRICKEAVSDKAGKVLKKILFTSAIFYGSCDLILIFSEL